ncbi:MAG: YopX family protein [Paludibacteraceae bacterium]
MREVKFRGKSKSTGYWLHGDLIRNVNGDIAIIPPFGIYNENEFGTQEVLPETVGQFTGLYDKKGKEIYEGDILNIPHGFYRNCEVIHSNYGWAFCTKDDIVYSDGSRQYRSVKAFNFIFGQGVVVGNIHDNPELMKGGEE